MTIQQIDNFKIKGKRKEHPMARKYPGRPCIEVGTALRKFYDDLDEDEKQWLLDGTLVFEEEVVASFFDSLQVGDVVGLGLVKGYEELDTSAPAAFKFEITHIYEGEDKIRVRNVSYKNVRTMEHTLKQELELCFEEVSWAFGLGMADVLERNGKLFGVSEEIEYEIKIMGEITGSNNQGPVSGSV